MALKQLQVVSVPVSDQGRAKAFYVDTLGFSLVSDTSSRATNSTPTSRRCPRAALLETLYLIHRTPVWSNNLAGRVARRQRFPLAHAPA
jgi:catechol 2,3-dioxygenase-like lactoylglutathione lyase family enzyme